MKELVTMGLTVVVWITAAVLGIYFGFWWAFIGGIVDIVNEVKGNVDALNIALGAAKIVFAGVIGVLTFYVSAAIGTLIAMFIGAVWPD